MAAAKKIGVVDVDRGYRRFMDSFRDAVGLPDLRARAGVLEPTGTEPAAEDSDGLTLAGMAAVQEFGSRDGHTPRRSFLRSTCRENRDKYRERLTEVARRALKANNLQAMESGIVRGLARLGAEVQGDIVRKITRGPFKPNAPSTIAAKGSSRPLVDTTRLRNSIAWAIDVDGDELTTTAKASPPEAKADRKARNAARASAKREARKARTALRNDNKKTAKLAARMRKSLRKQRERTHAARMARLRFGGEG